VKLKEKKDQQKCMFVFAKTCFWPSHFYRISLLLNLIDSVIRMCHDGRRSIKNTI